MDARETIAGTPFLELSRVHEGLCEELLSEFDGLIRSGAFVNGPAVAEFEREFAAYCGADHCVGVASGLDALRLALVAMGIGRGDEVIVPAQTFVATYEAIAQAGALPVPVDIGPDDAIDVSGIRGALNRRTAAILPVHLYGQLADMRAVREIADRAGLPVLEDACQAHGAVRDGLRAGSGGTAGAFSFYPGKNLGAFGDAGALVTNDSELATRIRALREHGQAEKYRHDVIGFTSRLDTLQAIVLRRKLPLLDGWNDERKRIARLYVEALAGATGLSLPVVPAGSSPTWHLFVVRTPEREALRDTLSRLGVGSGIHYPEPPHLTRAFGYLGHRPGAFPVAEALARECLSLPIFPGMRDDEVEQVVEAVSSHFA